ncbi:MAG TPA: flagellar basal body L-ring protein FlgH [Aquifex aeolicus]|uniref:Flagellar L-ring protein n=1 Tax=Aquifex aeolicus TaxID=63363 RepID=A0A7C5L3D3_AQUAO|nr:flagellar basal body L-ring protein FlgH [Aquifex aeolicus]
MGRILSLVGSFLTLLLLSCAEKPKDLKTYERENPFPEGYRTEGARGSLYRGGDWANLYGENRASKPGDLIFIRVVESINAIESVSNQMGRSSAFSNAISSFFGLPQSTLRNLGVEAEGTLDAKGASKIQQKGLLTTRLAGRVVKVYPNRTMLIEAKKFIMVNGMKREFVLMGIIRPEDIDSTNTVPSDRIANMEIFLDGKGYMAEGGKPGWLARIFAVIFPF